MSYARLIIGIPGLEIERVVRHDLIEVWAAKWWYQRSFFEDEDIKGAGFRCGGSLAQI